MPVRRTVLAGIAAGSLLAVARPAFAHRAARTETEVTVHPDGTVDVMHVYHLQDAKDALYKAGRLDRPDLTPLRARAKLALYTGETFALSNGGVPLALEIIGVEIEGDSVYVYQQGQAAAGPLSVDARMLRSLVPGQLNSVNLVRGGRTVTLDFRSDDGVKTVAPD